jgi:hypothetical protein
MKSSIKLGALSLLMSLGAITVSAKPRHHHKMDMPMDKQVVSIIPLKNDRGFAVRVDKMLPGKSVVMVYNENNDEIFSDRLTKGTTGEKKYLLRELDNGKYTVEVYSKGHDIKTNFYIYHNTTSNKRVVDIM